MEKQPEFTVTILELSEDTIKDELENHIMDLDYLSTGLSDNKEAQKLLITGINKLMEARMKMM